MFTDPWAVPGFSRQKGFVVTPAGAGAVSFWDFFSLLVGENSRTGGGGEEEEDTLMFPTAGGQAGATRTGTCDGIPFIASER